MARDVLMPLFADAAAYATDAAPPPCCAIRLLMRYYAMLLHYYHFRRLMPVLIYALIFTPAMLRFDMDIARHVLRRHYDTPLMLHGTL